MQQDNIVKGNEGIISGIVKVCEVIRPTYGAAGSNVVLEEEVYPFHSIRNDGKAIVDKIKLADKTENIGANIIKEAGDKADKDSGDGRKTTMLLVEAILKESKKVKGLPIEIKKNLDAEVPKILEYIDSIKKPITVKDIKSVAMVSSENEAIGSMVQKIYEKIGPNGIIEIDTSPLPEIFFEITEGVRLRGAKMFGHYSYTEPDKAVYKNPKILITKDKISTVDQLEPLLMALSASGQKELVIFCDDIDLAVASRLALTHIQGAFKTLIIKAPTLWKDWVYEDFAKITGASVIDSKEGRTFKNLSLENLGTCEKIVCTSDETRVIGIKDIKDHIENLEKLSKTNDQLLLRISWLQTKVAVLKVGANSESELSYLIKKAKDACAASYLALKDGVVAGGGVALYRASCECDSSILRNSLREPYNVLIKNSGFKDDGNSIGMNVKTGEKVDMFEAGIIDPAIVIKNAVKNAVSIAGTVLTSDGVIIKQ